MPGSGRSFPQDHRLKRPSEFKRVFANGVRTSNRLFTVVAMANDCGHARLGLAVSRRTAPHAVDRNALKRLTRESFRHRQSELSDLDLVVIPKRDALDADAATRREALETLWQKTVSKCAS